MREEDDPEQDGEAGFAAGEKRSGVLVETLTIEIRAACFEIVEALGDLNLCSP
jgi:hypothetical protein